MPQQGGITIQPIIASQLKKTFETGHPITALAIDPSGQLLAAARADHSIGLWNVTTGRVQVELRKHQDLVNALAFSPDGKTIARRRRSNCDPLGRRYRQGQAQALHKKLLA